MAIYTKKGDFGKADVLAKKRLDKYDEIFDGLGKLDQLNTDIGILKSHLQDQKLIADLANIQQFLIEYSGALAGFFKDKKEYSNKVAWLESAIDENENYYIKVDYFILPGESKEGALADRARVTAREAERAIVKFVHENHLETWALSYINRLSDYLYSVARRLDFRRNVQQIIGKDTQEYQVTEAKMTLDIAKYYAYRARQMAEELGVSIVVAIVESSGRPILIEAMDQSFLVSFDLARKKAFTASALKMPTEELKKLTAQGAMFEGLETMVEEELVPMGGGYPIYVKDLLIGAIGISGGTVKQDSDIAKQTVT